MILRAATRPHDDSTAEPHQLQVQTDDYNTGMVELRASCPEGWDLLHVIVDRD